MCLIVFGFQQHPRYDVVFAANRDEFYERPTRAAQFWKEHPSILAGKDLSAGGTWMGVNRRGQFAALTNYRDPSITQKNPPSRGEIVIDFLKQETNSKSFLKELHQRAELYNGFNVLAGSAGTMHHYSNQEQRINQVQPGVHGLSNKLLDTPWPKVEKAKSRLNNLMQNEIIDAEALFGLLQDDEPAPDDALPDTGIPRELEKQVSPIFIKSDDYGTRCSTILLMDKNGSVTFEEHRYKPGTMEVEDTNRFKFEITHP